MVTSTNLHITDPRGFDSMCRGPSTATAKEVEVKVMGDKEEQKEAKQAQPSIRALCKRA